MLKVRHKKSKAGVWEFCENWCNERRTKRLDGSKWSKPPVSSCLPRYIPHLFQPQKRRRRRFFAFTSFYWTCLMSHQTSRGLTEVKALKLTSSVIAPQWQLFPAAADFHSESSHVFGPLSAHLHKLNSRRPVDEETATERCRHPEDLMRFLKHVNAKSAQLVLSLHNVLKGDLCIHTACILYSLRYISAIKFMFLHDLQVV